MSSPNDRRLLLIAALLHDIGKVAQRADALGGYNKIMALLDKIGDIAPGSSGKWSYVHVGWTFQWLENYQTLWERLEIKESSEKETLYRIAARHHRGDVKDLLTKILIHADHISSGMQRVETESEADEVYGINFRPSSDAYPFQYMPMLSPFAVIEKSPEKFFQLPLKPLDITTSGFPEELEKAENLASKYKTLWEAFETDFKHLAKEVRSPDDFDAFYNTLLHLLFKYTWAVPSSTYGTVPTISLYHHLKTTAAIALALYDWCQENPAERFSLIKENSLEAIAQYRPFLLVMGDLSGIQAFIYNIYQSKAKSALKGRSFYLQLLTHVIAYELLKEVNGYPVQILSMAGGKFYLLLPNTKEVIEKLKAYRKHLQEWLWKRHKNTLYVSIDWIPFGFYTEGKRRLITLEEEDKGRLGTNKPTLAHLWELVRKRLHTQKHRRWSDLLQQNFNEFFVCSEEGGRLGAKQVCAVTGSFAPEKDMEVLNDVFVLKSVYEQITLGKALRKANYILFTQYELKSIAKGDAKMKIHNTWVIVCEQLPETIPENTFVFKINHTDFLPSSFSSKVSYGFLLYGGNKHALYAVDSASYRLASFEEIALIDEMDCVFPTDKIEDNQTNEKSEEQKWTISNRDDLETTYLAVLRCDVDNLGKLFSERIPPEHQSFAFFSTLSFLLEWFFAGYINTFQNQNAWYRKHLLIVYSGGDDLFVIGRWDVVLHFITHFREEFRRFVCEREDITLSVGLLLMKPKFPIHRAAEIAGEMEEKAKHYPNKNAFTLFEIPVSYKEWQWVMDLIPKLCRLNSSLLHRLNYYYYDALVRGGLQIDVVMKRSPTYLRFLAHLAYTIGRYHNEKTLLEVLKKINQFYWGGSALNGGNVDAERAFVLLAIAIQCAILFKRTFENLSKELKSA